MILSTSIDKIPFGSIWYSTPNYDYEGNWMIDSKHASIPARQTTRYVNIESFIVKLIQVENMASIVSSECPSTFCAICLDNNDETHNYSITVDDREIRWSKGLFHYYDEHGIVPSRQFYNIIMSYSIKKPRRIRSKKDRKEGRVTRDLERSLKYLNIN